MASVKEDLNVDRQNAQTAETSNPKPGVVPIRVAFSGRQEETVLHTIRVSSTDTGEEVMKKLRAQNQEHRSKFSALFEAFMRASVMQRIAVQVVTVSPSDVERQACPQRVLVEAKEYSAVLTDGYRHPRVLRSATEFANSHLEYALGNVPLETTKARKALFIGYVFDQKSACVWGGIALLLAVANGVVAGVVAGSLTLGLARGTALLTGLSAVQILIIWLVS